MISASTRRGSVLPMVFTIAILIAGLLLTSSDRVMGVKRVQELGASKQQAAYAAEAVAAIKEVQMVNLAATNDLSGLDSKPTPNAGTCWFGNCLVRWRIEPVKVQNPTGTYTVNPVADANALAPAAAGYLQNYEYYVYRIATEANYLADGERGDQRPFNLAPGEAADGRTYNALNKACAVQASRTIQLKLNSLFKYAIFYAAEGTTGDLEFWVGTGISVQGAIHSNGAIYIGGQGNNYLGGNYKDSCSYGGSVTLGSAAKPISICGFNGVYRMRKVCNVMEAKTGGPAAGLPRASPDSEVPLPMAVPLSGVGGMSGTADLNGDDGSSTLHNLNGKPFTCANDSRSAAWNGGSNVFSPYVRDSQLGGTVVKTLSNIPQLAGRPFEAQRLASEGQVLCWKSATDHTFTVHEQTDPLIPPVTPELFYTDFAGGDYTPTDVAVDGSGVARTKIYAKNMPLYTPLVATDTPDVWPDTTAPSLIPAGSVNEGFPDREAHGYYFDKAFIGDAVGGPTGLLIRERPAQKTAVYPLGAYAALGRTGAMPDPAVLPWSLLGFPVFAAEYRDYLKSQFMVLLGGFDVTDAFFAQIGSAASTSAFIASEDRFINLREATDMQVFYGVNRATGMPGAQPYKVDALTLNLRAIQDWLKTTDWSALTGGGSDKAKDHFNGLIYAHRTRRSSTFDALLRPTVVFNRGSSANPYTLPAAVAYPQDKREGDGPIESFHCAIRVRGGANIDWAHSGAAAPLGTSGLTICTPNMCYMQGDFNTSTHPDASGTAQTPPCAVFADGITALSNSWDDASHQVWSTALLDGSATTYNVSYVINNVPSDAITCEDEGSGAVANVVRFLENWGGRAYNFKGSLVVMNSMRYSYTTLGASGGPFNLGTGFYSPPTRNLSFNTDLLTRSGQPPYTPFGVQVIRTVSTLTDVTQ